MRTVSSTWNNSVKRYYATCPVVLDFSTDARDNGLTIPDVVKARLLGECKRLEAIKFSRPRFSLSSERLMAHPTDDDYKRMDHFYQLLVCKSEEQKQKFKHVKELNLELNGVRNLPIVANEFEDLTSLNLDIFEAQYLRDQIRCVFLDQRVWQKFTMLKQLTLRTCSSSHLMRDMFEFIAKPKVPLILQSFTLASQVYHRDPLSALLRLLAACPLLTELKMVPIYINGIGFGPWDWLNYLISTLQKLPHFRKLSFFITGSFPLTYLMRILPKYLQQLETLEIHKSINPKTEIGRNSHGDDGLASEESLPNLRQVIFGKNFAICVPFLNNLISRCHRLVELHCSLRLQEITTDYDFKSIFFTLAALPNLHILDLQLSYSYQDTHGNENANYPTSQKIRELIHAKIKRIFAQTSPELQLTISFVCAG